MLIAIQSPVVPVSDLVRALVAARFPVDYRRDPLLRDQWLFAETSGSIATDSVGDVEGTLTPSATREPHGPPGLRAVHISGANDSYVSFGTEVGQFSTADFAVLLWLKTAEQLRLFDIVGNRTEFGHGVFVSIRMTGQHESLPHGILIAEVDQNGTNYVLVQSSRSGLNDGTWHHVAAVRAGGTLRLYVDGQASGTGQAGGPADIKNGRDFRLGRSLLGGGDAFAPNANYADLRVYDGAINDHQIWEVFATPGGRSVPPPGPVPNGTIGSPHRYLEHTYVEAVGQAHACRLGRACGQCQ